MNVLIIEDEARAANRLERLLVQLAPHFRIIGKLESVREAVGFLRNEALPDLIFSDIQLADGLSFKIFEEVPAPCPIIFTTAYDQYAIEAFQTNGIDYLLKPVEEDRLAQSLDKLERIVPRISPAQLLALTRASQPRKRYKRRFLIKVGDEIKSVAVERIKAFYSEQKTTMALLDNQRRYVLDQSLSELEASLDPTEFFRISRKHIVHLDACEKIYAHSNSRLKLVIAGLEDQSVIVARERVADFKAWLAGEL